MRHFRGGSTDQLKPWRDLVVSQDHQVCGLCWWEKWQTSRSQWLPTLRFGGPNLLGVDMLRAANCSARAASFMGMGGPPGPPGGGKPFMVSGVAFIEGLSLPLCCKQGPIGGGHPMAYLTKELNKSLAKLPLKFSGSLAQLGLTSLSKIGHWLPLLGLLIKLVPTHSGKSLIHLKIV